MYRALFEAFPQAIILTDEAFVVKRANLAALTLLNVEENQLIGDTLSSAVLLNNEASTLKLARGSTQWVPARGSLHQIGSEHDIKIRQLNTHKDSNFYVFYILQNQDEKLVFRQLRSRSEAASALASEEIVARQSLTEANNRLNSFAFRAAHDIRNPLNHVRLLMNYLKTSNTFDERTLDLINHVEQSTDQLMRLVSDLLTYSNMIDRSLDLKVINLSAIINDLRITLEDNSVNEGWLTVSDLPDVSCDPSLIQIVFQNLLSNAKKYRSPDRNLAVSIECESNTANTLVVHVRDNGLGFRQEAASRIFEPLERYHSQIQGNGLGLAMCRELLTSHGWSIIASGEEGAGACFSILIPFSSIVQRYCCPPSEES